MIGELTAISLLKGVNWKKESRILASMVSYTIYHNVKQAVKYTRMTFDLEHGVLVHYENT